MRNTVFTKHHGTIVTESSPRGGQPIQHRKAVVTLRMRNLFSIALTLVFLFMVVMSTPASAKQKTQRAGDSEKDATAIDYLALAAIMIRDGYNDRAEAVLKQVDLSAEGLDLARYHSLSGLVALKSSLYADAQSHFLTSREINADDAAVPMYLAQACYGLKDYHGAIEALDQAGDIVNSYPAIFTMRAHCLWNLKKHGEAFDVLNTAMSLFPESTEFARQQIYYLIDLGLYQQAVEDGLSYLSRALLPPTDYVALGEALRRSHQLNQALVILEAAKITFPRDTKVLISLGHCYLDRGSLKTAATLFEMAALIDSSFIVEAAELHRRAGNFHRALLLNGQVQDQQKKVRQRVGILLEMEHYEEIAALEPRLSRLGLLNDDEIRYALAYVKFQTGKYDEARQLVRKISRSDLFATVTELMKAMENR